MNIFGSYFPFLNDVIRNLLHDNRGFVQLFNPNQLVDGGISGFLSFSPPDHNLILCLLDILKNRQAPIYFPLRD